MLKIVDIWEADVNLNVPVLIDGGVVGMVVRLNDMNGGHHKDELFDLNWERAKLFPVQSIYFVYNPWVSGQENFDWLYANLPSDFGRRRLFADIEVVYSGYNPVTYSNEVLKFKQLVSDHNLCSNYTGAGYLHLLSKWPTGSYWWARYPYIVAPPEGLTLTWAQLDGLIAQMNFRDADPNGLCPGTVDLWQCTDRVVLPGVNGRAIDVSLFPGTITELENFFNIESKEDPVGIYTNFAKLIFLYEGCGLVDAEQLRGHVDGIIGEIGVGDKPKAKFKDWAELAKTLDVPFIGYVSSDPVIYLPMTYNPAVWPDAAHDPTCNMMDTGRHYPSGQVVRVDGWIVDGSKYADAAGKPIPDTWIASIWDHTYSRVAQRFGKKVFPLMKKDTLTQKVSPIPPNGTLLTALSKMPTLSTYELSTSHVPTGWGEQFIPSDTEGPRQPYAPKWDFWWYGSARFSTALTGGIPLFLFNGTPSQLNSQVGFVPGSVTPPPPPIEVVDLQARADIAAIREVLAKGLTVTGVAK